MLQSVQNGCSGLLQQSLNMTIRDRRQKEFADAWLNSGKFAILNLCPRFGKIYTTINILEKLKPKSVLIAYPDNKIKQSWKDDFEKRGWDDSNVTYTTHLSIKKHLEDSFDLIVIDEIHLLSEAQIEAVKELIANHDSFRSTGAGHVLGLTGTLSSHTERTLYEELNLSVSATYSIEQAIQEGVVVDYEITVVKVPLDDLIKNNYKGKQRTEKQQFDAYGYVIDGLERSGKSTMFLRLARMRIIQNSIAKLRRTKKILSEHKDDRILVFCGVTKIADQLGIPSYHSKKEEKKIFDDFVEGKGKHLAVVKIGNTGVTYKPLNRVIINYFDSNGENLAQKINRCMAMEYDNPDKKAQIYIISSDETVELKWLQKALEFFDKTKIRYI
jgi:superfamily II DNA or RNA helicase